MAIYSLSCCPFRLDLFVCVPPHGGCHGLTTGWPCQGLTQGCFYPVVRQGLFFIP